jgi:hypothetical protein
LNQFTLIAESRRRRRDRDHVQFPALYFRYASRALKGAGKEHAVDIESDPEAAGRVLAVLHQRLTGIATDDWTLDIAFDNGCRIVCNPDPQYEAWTAVGPAIGASYCPPGGAHPS